jgi:hypothetical protein
LTGLIFDLFMYSLPSKYTSYSGYIALNGHHSELGCNSAMYLEGLWSKSWPTVHVFCWISCFAQSFHTHLKSGHDHFLPHPLQLIDISHLNHVVTLCSEARHMTIDVNYLLMTHSLQHRVNNNETTCPSHTSAVNTESQCHHSCSNKCGLYEKSAMWTLLRNCLAESGSVTTIMEYKYWQC